MEAAMSEAVKDGKFTALFGWFDQNKDGYLTHEDFQQMAEMFAAVAQDDQANASAMRDAVENWWGLLLASGDTDADGRLARPEFVEVMKSNVTSPGNFESAVLAIADALMSALDTNNDGVVDSREYDQMYSTLGIPPSMPATPSVASTVTATVSSAMRNSGTPFSSSILATTRTLQETG